MLLLKKSLLLRNKLTREVPEEGFSGRNESKSINIQDSDPILQEETG